MFILIFTNIYSFFYTNGIFDARASVSPVEPAVASIGERCLCPASVGGVLHRVQFASSDFSQSSWRFERKSRNGVCKSAHVRWPCRGRYELVFAGKIWP